MSALITPQPPPRRDSFLEMQRRRQARPAPPGPGQAAAASVQAWPQSIGDAGATTPQIAPPQTGGGGYPGAQPAPPVAQAPPPAYAPPTNAFQPPSDGGDYEWVPTGNEDEGQRWTFEGGVPVLYDPKNQNTYRMTGGLSQAGAVGPRGAGSWKRTGGGAPPTGSGTPGNAGQPEQPAAPPPNPARQGWTPGMNPFDPQAVAASQRTAQPRVETPPPFDVTTATRPNSAPPIQEPDDPYAGIPGAGDPWQTDSDRGDQPWQDDGQPFGNEGFNIEKWLLDFMNDSNNQDTFNPSGGRASNFGAPGATDRYGSPEFDYDAPRSDAATERLLMDLLRNPSAYDDATIQRQFGRLSGGIDDQYDQENTRIQEDMVRRGLGDSTVYGGRLQDSNVMRRSAKTDLGERILDTAAQTRSADKARAISTGMGYTDQKFGQQNVEFQNAMQSAGFNSNESQRMFDNAFKAAQFGREGQEIDYEQGLRTFMTNQNVKSLNFNQQMAIAESWMRAAQQAFNNQMRTAEFNDGNDDEFMDWLNNLIGG